MMDRDDPGAFCAHGRITVDGAPDGPLAGLTFAVKDLFDVAGVPTGAGNPDWLRTHPVPARTAPAVQALLDAGARLTGKTHTDELAWSLAGENAHYGTPVNPAAPGRIPGGSSSGSAAAVAGGAVAFAPGTDTGGSVRLPASYCGVYGLRPGHGRIPVDGVVPLAPSFDTVGWFARDAATLRRVGTVLLPGPPAPRPARLLIAADAFAIAGEAVTAALADAVARVAALFGSAEPVTLAPEGPDALVSIFRTLQAAEAWAVHGAWITATRPSFGPGVAERFAGAATIDPAAADAAARQRAAVRARLDDLLGGDAVVVLPTAPGIAPRRGASGPEVEANRNRSLALLCPAGLAGLPQVSIPAATADGCPLGLSLMASRGADAALLDLAAQLGDSA
ncbi:amidase [Azospirillum halopraeferens]|uniref:amidase n=1 Tax=Azospirillum halopraeferens TaxID=34010 RepID=UPI0004134BCE|nr:amidase [Azospirillum halopraeferens]